MNADHPSSHVGTGDVSHQVTNVMGQISAVIIQTKRIVVSKWGHGPGSSRVHLG